MKKSINKISLLFILICFPGTLCGCWDYVEMNDVKYAAGLTIDKDKNTNEYILAIEVLKPSQDGKSMKSDIIQSKGKTIHVALRDAIKNAGKQLQLSHMKIIIVSEDIAREGLISVIDVINRDAEIRNDMWILISHMDTASEIFTNGKNDNVITSYELAFVIENNNKIGKYIPTEVFKLIDNISAKGISATVPMVKTVKSDKEMTLQVFGTAVFKQDKMVDELNEEESLILQLLKEKKIKFLIPIVLENNQNVCLEMMDVDRKIKPKIEEDKISIDIYIDMDVALSEISGTGEDYVSKKQRDKVKEQSEKYIEDSANKLIEKLQKQYKSDAIGFGEALMKKKPNEWRKVSNNWSETFENINIHVFVNMNIKYNGLTNKIIEVGD